MEFPQKTYQKLIDKFVTNIYSIKIENYNAKTEYLKYLQHVTEEIQAINSHFEVLATYAEYMEDKNFLKNESINIINSTERAETFVRNINKFFFLKELDRWRKCL